MIMIIGAILFLNNISQTLTRPQHFDKSMMITILTNKIEIFSNFLQFPNIPRPIKLSIVINSSNHIIRVNLFYIFRLLFNNLFDFLLDCRSRWSRGLDYFGLRFCCWLLFWLWFLFLW